MNHEQTFPSLVSPKIARAFCWRLADYFLLALAWGAIVFLIYLFYRSIIHYEIRQLSRIFVDLSFVFLPAAAGLTVLWLHVRVAPLIFTYSDRRIREEVAVTMLQPNEIIRWRFRDAFLRSLLPFVTASPIFIIIFTVAFHHEYINPYYSLLKYNDFIVTGIVATSMVLFSIVGLLDLLVRLCRAEQQSGAYILLPVAWIAFSIVAAPAGIVALQKFSDIYYYSNWEENLHIYLIHAPVLLGGPIGTALWILLIGYFLTKLTRRRRALRQISFWVVFIVFVPLASIAFKLKYFFYFPYIDIYISEYLDLFQWMIAALILVIALALIALKQREHFSSRDLVKPLALGIALALLICATFYCVSEWGGDATGIFIHALSMCALAGWAIRKRWGDACEAYFRFDW